MSAVGNNRGSDSSMVNLFHDNMDENPDIWQSQDKDADIPPSSDTPASYTPDLYNRELSHVIYGIKPESLEYNPEVSKVEYNTPTEKPSYLIETDKHSDNSSVSRGKMLYIKSKLYEMKTSIINWLNNTWAKIIGKRRYPENSTGGRCMQDWQKIHHRFKSPQIQERLKKMEDRNLHKFANTYMDKMNSAMQNMERYEVRNNTTILYRGMDVFTKNSMNRLPLEIMLLLDSTEKDIDNESLKDILIECMTQGAVFADNLNQLILDKKSGNIQDAQNMSAAILMQTLVTEISLPSLSETDQKKLAGAVALDCFDRLIGEISAKDQPLSPCLSKIDAFLNVFHSLLCPEKDEVASVRRLPDNVWKVLISYGVPEGCKDARVLGVFLLSCLAKTDPFSAINTRPNIKTLEAWTEDVIHTLTTGKSKDGTKTIDVLVKEHFSDPNFKDNFA